MLLSGWLLWMMRVAIHELLALEIRDLLGRSNLAALNTFLMSWSCWLQGGSRRAPSSLGGTGEHPGPSRAVIILAQILVILVLFILNLDSMDGLVQNSLEFKCGMIVPDPNSPCSQLYLN